MSIDWREIAAEAEAQAVVIQDGPLNRTSLLSIDTRKVIIRRRLMPQNGYGQFFAAERIVTPLLGSNVRIPKLLAVDDDDGYGVALFDYIENEPIDWASTHILDAVAAGLACIHSITNSAVGPISEPKTVDDINIYLLTLLISEIELLSDDIGIHKSPFRNLIDWARCHLKFGVSDICLCHGDVHGGNFLRDARSQLWIIDWEAARYRVPASDFNQIAEGWMPPRSQEYLIAKYCSLTSRDYESFISQISFFSILWNVRTHNFNKIILNSPPKIYKPYLERAINYIERLS